MDWCWILLLMVFCHIIEDFHIQGILANLKQQSWWYEQIGYTRRYRYDYIPAILMHGLEWSVFIHIPLMFVYGFTSPIFISVLINAMLHAYIDDMKCNRHTINLVQDQSLHLMQIALTCIIITLLS